MRVFVWQRVKHCSDNYHREGGVVVFASTEPRARELANAIPGCSIEETEKPDDVRSLNFFASDESREETVYIMPDAGIC
ncbi:MAG: hypothetical protein GY941_15050 [Planctomycetes bacterium]|nr:hypothetical protein [Planctomycetota bacterium]